MQTLTKAQKIAAKRSERKAARLCMQCAAGLQESDVVLCVECFEAREQSRLDYEARNPGRRRRSENAPSRQPQTRREQYHARKNAGLCTVRGCKSNAYGGGRRCKHHRAEERRHSLNHQRRRHWPRIAARNLFKAARAAAKGMA